jgi:hypothetical protein
MNMDAGFQQSICIAKANAQTSSVCGILTVRFVGIKFYFHFHDCDDPCLKRLRFLYCSSAHVLMYICACLLPIVIILIVLFHEPG